METPPEATLAGFDIRTPRAGALRPMSQVAILTPRPPSRPLARRRKPHRAFADHPSSQSEHASCSARWC